MIKAERRNKALNPECTSILVGKNMTADGSLIISRSEDWDAFKAKHFEVYPHNERASKSFKALDTDFSCEDLPEVSYEYKGMPPFDVPGHWASAWFNEAGVGMSATETIFNNDKVLSIDPYLKTGITESTATNIVLPYIRSAREGVLRLGSLIEKYGTGEGFGISFVDNREIWYLETACGHHWLAAKIPDDVYFVSANQGRLRDYDPEDKDNYLASEGLIDFAVDNNLYSKVNKFDFHNIFSVDGKNDLTYNYTRVWALQGMFSPDLSNDITKNNFPVYAKAQRKISLEDLKRAFRFHYQNTVHDPYLNHNPKEPYRPISIFRTTQTHILQVRPELPKEIGEIVYVAVGMAALSVFLPYYQGMERFIEGYDKGTDKASDDSVYWKYRKLQTLGMVNYNKYAPVIQKAYSEFENFISYKQKEMEREYLENYKKDASKGKRIIQNFCDRTMKDALQLTDDLSNEIFTMLAKDIQQEYLFHGA